MSGLSVQILMTSPPPAISPHESLRRARELMQATQVSELLVIDDGRLVGTLSERDIWEHCPTSALVLNEQEVQDLLGQIRVGGVMALHPPTISLDIPLHEVAQLFARSKRHILVVIGDGGPIGILTKDTVMQAVATLLEEVVRVSQK